MDENLIQLICRETQLPTSLISAELTRLIDEAGLHPDQITLEELRRILTSYLQDVLLGAKNVYSNSTRS